METPPEATAIVAAASTGVGPVVGSAPDPQTGDGSGGGMSSGVAAPPEGYVVDEADRHLPIANISRIMKRVLPSNAQVSKDTKSYIQLCVSEFISFITSEASDKCIQEKRKTINGDVSNSITLISVNRNWV